jgi:NAD(P)H-flavin reductase
VHLIYANVTEEDILLRTELEQFAQDPRINITFTLDKVGCVFDLVSRSFYSLMRATLYLVVVRVVRVVV